ncbi:hypothetical protein J4H86_10250 [Spiractinospora alimapuensis]|uniref:hypothetical protein n=1 Tax=Spiractinospora alimapuensis TaxID=2820884 RepID=UPI001F23D767|nr:hypothetical protein [Spiractinospora alimapuensis]QVQ54042.1 hypothetical protein J4H86_10250 [Spiractinospora alimapuensis]
MNTNPVTTLLNLLTPHGAVFYRSTANPTQGRTLVSLSIKRDNGQMIHATLTNGMWHVAGRTYPAGAEHHVAIQLLTHKHHT